MPTRIRDGGVVGADAGHDDERNRGVVGDGVRDVAEVQRRKPPRSGAGQHEQVSVPRLGRLEEHDPGVSLKGERLILRQRPASGVAPTSVEQTGELGVIGHGLIGPPISQLGAEHGGDE